MRGDTQISQNSIYFFNGMVSQVVFKVSEVCPDKNEPLIFRNIDKGILILVKYYKPAIFTQLFKNFLGVTPASKGQVYITALWFNI